jgi:hypothetical protein
MTKKSIAVGLKSPDLRTFTARLAQKKSVAVGLKSPDLLPFTARLAVRLHPRLNGSSTIVAPASTRHGPLWPKTLPFIGIFLLVQTQVAAESAFWDNSKDLGEYHVISSFTQPLTVIFFLYYFLIHGNIRSIDLLFLYYRVLSIDLVTEERLV